MRAMVAGVLAASFVLGLHYVLVRFRVVKISYTHRAEKYAAHVRLLGGLGVLGLGVFFACHWSLTFLPAQAPASLWAVLIFAPLFFIYMTFYFAMDRSVQERMMIELDSAPEQELDFEGILRVYDPDTKFRNEIDGMLDEGFLRVEGESYVMTPKGQLYARLARWAKRVLHLGEGG